MQGRALYDTLRTFRDGPIEILKSEGRDVLALRQRALATNLPTVDYVPIDPGRADATAAGMMSLEHLRDLLSAVVSLARAAEKNAKHLALVRFEFEEGRLRLVALDGHRLVRAVHAVPGGEALAGFQLAAIDADRLARLLAAYWQYVHPKSDETPVRVRLSVRAGEYLSGEFDALRFTLPHDPRVFPDYTNAIPRKLPDVIVVSHSELRGHLYGLRRLFADSAEPKAQLRICADGILVSATHPDSGELIEHKLADASSYGRTFSRLVNINYLIDALEQLPSACHHAIACDAEVLTTPIVVLPWPRHGGRTQPKTRVWEHVALGLKVATFALVMPMRMSKEEDHGCPR